MLNFPNPPPPPSPSPPSFADYWPGGGPPILYPAFAGTDNISLPSCPQFALPPAGHYIRLRPERGCAAYCKFRLSWELRCAECRCAGCPACTSPAFAPDPSAACTGDGAAEDRLVRSVGCAPSSRGLDCDRPVVILEGPLRRPHAAGVAIELLEENVCPLRCSGRGTCVRQLASCVCDAGFVGLGCER